MKTENLKVGDVLIAIDECLLSDSATKSLIIGKDYPIKKRVGDLIYIECEVFSSHTFKIEDLHKYFKEAPKGKHTGYIVPIDLKRGCIKKGFIVRTETIDSFREYYDIETDLAKARLIADVVEQWEKYYEPVEEKITIGGEKLKISGNCVEINNVFWHKKELTEVLRIIKSEPNLADKLELIINKMEGK